MQSIQAALAHSLPSASPVSGPSTSPSRDVPAARKRGATSPTTGLSPARKRPHVVDPPRSKKQGAKKGGKGTKVPVAQPEEDEEGDVDDDCREVRPLPTIKRYTRRQKGKGPA